MLSNVQMWALSEGSVKSLQLNIFLLLSVHRFKQDGSNNRGAIVASHSTPLTCLCVLHLLDLFSHLFVA